MEKFEEEKKNYTKINFFLHFLHFYTIKCKKIKTQFYLNITENAISETIFVL